jgi:thiol-disulfide isomerase/thioredoxin
LFSSFCTNGKFISLKNLKGKYILLDFWASWCAPCLQSIPIMKEIYKNHRKEKLVIIGVNIDSDFNLLKNAELKYQIDWLDIFDKNSKIANLYTVDKIPTFFLIDQSGAIIFRGEGLGDKEILRSILNEKLN